MTKSKAQKARARARRNALNGKLRRPPPRQKLKGRNATALVPFVPRKALPQRPPRRKRARGFGSPMKMITSSDGLNQSMTMVNNSVIEERFQTRFEKVTDLLGTTSGFALLTNGQFYLNPGNTVLFPIFSKIASTYEQYRVNVLRFHYVTQCYTASGSNVGAGRILMATDFDPDAANFVTKQQMENYEKCIAFEPYAKHVIHDVVVASKARKGMGMGDLALKNYFVNGSANQLSPVTNGAKFYDIGNFQVAGSGTVDATSTIGELWVEYSFTMIRPIQDIPLGDTILVAHYITTPVTAASRFLSGAQQTGSNMSLTLAANTITLPFAGNFLVVCNFTAATTYTDANSFSAGTGGTLLAVFCSNGVADNSNQPAVGSATAALVVLLVVACTVPNVVLTYAGTPTIVGASKADIWISAVPSDIVTAFKKDKIQDRLDFLEQQFEKMRLDKWNDSRLDVDYCNSRAPLVPLRHYEDDTKSVSSRRSQPK